MTVTNCTVPKVFEPPKPPKRTDSSFFYVLGTHGKVRSRVRGNACCRRTSSRSEGKVNQRKLGSRTSTPTVTPYRGSSVLFSRIRGPKHRPFVIP